jgi:tetratricopeptide (TPR) repeat protein
VLGWFRNRREKARQSDKHDPRPAALFNPEWQRAIAVAELRLAQHPNDLEALRGKATALGNLGRYEEALEANAQVLRVDTALLAPPKATPSFPVDAA